MKKYILLVVLLVFSSCVSKYKLYYLKEKPVASFVTYFQDNFSSGDANIANIYLIDKIENKYVFGSISEYDRVVINDKYVARNEQTKLDYYHPNIQKEKCIGIAVKNYSNSVLDKLEEEIKDKEICVDNPVKIDRIKQGYKFCLYDLQKTESEFYASNKCEKYKNKMYKREINYDKKIYSEKLDLLNPKIK
ncbi:MAG: hypothetical protein Ta2D_12080 [Rickettsiales bacterium]|nr:MAG: hypothetical protein Ta2D_12080 [Rickettsiales bacterium]